MISYQYDGKKIKMLVDGEEKGDFSLEDFLFHERDLVDHLSLCLSEHLGEVMGAGDHKHIKNHAKVYILDHFDKFLKEKSSIKESDLKKEEKILADKFESFGEQALKDTKKFLYDTLDTFFGKKILTGGDMFKNIKEAKAFTAHLDALASEIEGLSDVSSEMKRHLAYRLDRLSDLIEGSVKSAASDKEANGVGDGAWVHDEDEKYMETMGGTGPLVKDKDEPYMDLFKNDQNKQVLERKEPKEIQGDGVKKEQPSDNYDEAAVAKKIRSMVKNVLSKK